MRVEPTTGPQVPESAPRRFVRGPAPADEIQKADDPARAPREPRFAARSLLKFDVNAADVDAKFEIHKPTSTVTVTMYERETGEVLREVPSKYLLDVIASVASGRHVDTTS